jgi:hypothetical protein
MNRIKLLLATLGGGERSILTRSGVDGTRLAGRGIAAIIPAIFGAGAVCIAFKYAFALSLPAAAAAGLVWGGIVLCFDLSLMTHGSDGGLVRRVAGFGLRAVVAVLAAFTFASPIVIWMFSSDIAVRVALDQQNGLASYNKNVIGPKYAGETAKDDAAITSYQTQLANAQRSVSSAQLAVQNAKTQLTCEGSGVADAAGCGTGTGKFGEGPVYRVRVTELENAEAGLAQAEAAQKAVEGAVGPQLQAAKSGLASLSSEENSDYASAEARYGRDDGLIARWTALNELEASSPTVRLRAWGLEALIVAIDLSAVIARMVTTTPSYDRRVEVERDQVRRLAADEEADLEERMLRRRTERQAETAMQDAWHNARLAVNGDDAAAWTEVERHRIRAWVETETGQRWDSDFPQAARDSDVPGPTKDSVGLMAAPAENIPGPDLGTFTANMRAHEQVPERFDGRATRFAWIGVGLLGALGAVLLLLRLDHSAVNGDWLAPLGIAAALAMAAYTRGFRQGPAWAHQAGFAVGCLVIPLAASIVLLNV